MLTMFQATIIGGGIGFLLWVAFDKVMTNWGKRKK